LSISLPFTDGTLDDAFAFHETLVDVLEQHPLILQVNQLVIEKILYWISLGSNCLF
jgi:hypothetical protein